MGEDGEDQNKTTEKNVNIFLFMYKHSILRFARNYAEIVLLYSSHLLYQPVSRIIGFNADADPDPDFNLNADPDPIRIQETKLTRIQSWALRR